MQFPIGFSIMLLATLVLARDQPLFGGHRPVSAVDDENMEAAKILIQEALEKRLQDKYEEYEPHVTLEEINAEKQLVNGMIYHLKLNATYNFDCSRSVNKCPKKEPEVKTCTARVLKPLSPYASVMFAKGTLGPRCY